jgi:translocation and assembly module TamB
MAMLGEPIQDTLTESGLGFSTLYISSDIASQFILIRPLEKRIREVFNLDLFSIRTQIIQNLILSRFRNSNQNPSLYSDSAGMYLDNTTITIGKYFGDHIFFETLIILERGVQEGDIQTDIFLTLEFPTPFFNLKWTVSPKLLNQNEMALPSSSLTFLYKYSY